MKQVIYKGKKHHSYICPVVEIINDNVWRIYYSFQDKTKLLLYGWYNFHISYIEVEAENPSNILYNHDESIIKLGRLGSFDCDGMVLSCILGDCYIYSGIYKDSSVGIRKSIGVLVKDLGKDLVKDAVDGLRRVSKGPVLSIGIDDPYSVYDPCIIEIDGTYHMWYTSITKWKMYGVTPEYVCTIKHAESTDMSHWTADNYNCFEGKNNECSPFVMYADGMYRMWYVRKSDTIGYAESVDGKHWDDVVFDGPSCINHPHVIVKDSTLYMFYSECMGKSNNSKLCCAMFELKNDSLCTEVI